jgi:lipoyl(octanoyl) transferase
MAIDEAMLLAHQEGRTPPTLRFYGWSPAALSIGYFQQAEKEVDLEELRRRGVGFVRRPTGGRAVLHDKELTYSIVISESYPGMQAGVEETCRALSEGLLRGFHLLGLDAEIKGSGGMTDSEAPKPESAACFDTPSRYELVLEGRKTAGSSQMRAKGVILQHGSVPLELDADLLFDVLRFDSEEEKSRAKRIFERKSVAIGDGLRNKNLPVPTMEAVERAFFAGFGEGLEADLVSGVLSGYEEELAARLAAEKYVRDDWNMRR